MEVIIIVILIILLLVFIKSIIKWKVSATAMIYYMEKKEYTLPSELEMEECTGIVVKHMLKDLGGKKDGNMS